MTLTHAGKNHGAPDAERQITIAKDERHLYLQAV
jgi:hypothetical protein